MQPLTRYLSSESPTDASGRQRLSNDAAAELINRIKNAYLIIFILIIFIKLPVYTLIPLSLLIILYYVYTFNRILYIYDSNLEKIKKIGYSEWYSQFF
jgi:hypothetical protein